MKAKIGPPYGQYYIEQLKEEVLERKLRTDLTGLKRNDLVDLLVKDDVNSSPPGTVQPSDPPGTSNPDRGDGSRNPDRSVSHPDAPGAPGDHFGTGRESSQAVGGVDAPSGRGSHLSTTEMTARGNTPNSPVGTDPRLTARGARDKHGNVRHRIDPRAINPGARDKDGNYTRYPDGTWPPGFEPGVEVKPGTKNADGSYQRNEDGSYPAGFEPQYSGVYGGSFPPGTLAPGAVAPAGGAYPPPGVVTGGAFEVSPIPRSSNYPVGFEPGRYPDDAFPLGFDPSTYPAEDPDTVERRYYPVSGQVVTLGGLVIGPDGASEKEHPEFESFVGPSLFVYPVRPLGYIHPSMRPPTGVYPVGSGTPLAVSPGTRNADGSFVRNPDGTFPPGPVKDLATSGSGSSSVRAGDAGTSQLVESPPGPLARNISPGPVPNVPAPAVNPSSSQNQGTTGAGTSMSDLSGNPKP